jgi:ribosome-binding factor A
MTSKVARTLIIDAYKKKLQQETRQKMAKKGLLTKIVASKKKRANVLVNILQESNNFNTLNNDSFRSSQQTASSSTSGDSSSSCSSSSKKSDDDEFLKKYYQASQGGPKHSIAVSRAHHLTNFLTEYILNAFSSGQFATPDIAEFKSANLDFADDYVFEISRIELLADLTALKIYWLNSGNDKLDAYVECFINSKMQAHIRQTLSNERVMSYVPRVVFVQDQTNALMQKLDEHLAQVKLECEQQGRQDSDAQAETNTPHERNELVVVAATEKPVATKKAIDNLYGVDFNRLIEKIKKNNPTECSLYSPNTDLNEASCSAEVALANKEQVNLEARTKFERSLKAYQINKRIDHQKVNKSAILKMSMLEMERKRIDDELDHLKTE